MSNERSDTGELVDEPHAAFDSTRAGGVGGELYQGTRGRCAEVEEVGGRAGRGQIAARAHVGDFYGVRLDSMSVVYFLGEGRESYRRKP